MTADQSRGRDLRSMTNLATGSTVWLILSLSWNSGPTRKSSGSRRRDGTGLWGGAIVKAPDPAPTSAPRGTCSMRPLPRVPGAPRGWIKPCGIWSSTHPNPLDPMNFV